MNVKTIARLREIERFLVAVRDLTDKDLTVQRLSVLLEVAIRGPVEQGEVVRIAKLRRSATSKSVAVWSGVGHSPFRLIESEIDGDNRRNRILSLTEDGATTLESALHTAGLI